MLKKYKKKVKNQLVEGVGSTLWIVHVAPMKKSGSKTAEIELLKFVHTNFRGNTDRQQQGS